MGIILERLLVYSMFLTLPPPNKVPHLFTPSHNNIIPSQNFTVGIINLHSRRSLYCIEKWPSGHNITFHGRNFITSGGIATGVKNFLLHLQYYSLSVPIITQQKYKQQWLFLFLRLLATCSKTILESDVRLPMNKLYNNKHVEIP